MNVKITIEAPELVCAILALSEALQGRLENAEKIKDSITPEVKEDKPKEVEAATEVNTETKAEVKQEVTINAEDIRKMFVTLSKKGKKAELKKILTGLGVDKVSDLKEEQFADAMAKLEAIE